MTDPTSKTVRGWQVDILAALSGFAALPDLLSEFQYLNRRMFGADAAGSVLPAAQAPAVRDALVRPINNGSSELVNMGLLEYLTNRFNQGDDRNIPFQIDQLRAEMGVIGQRLVNPDDGASVAEQLFFVIDTLGVIAARLALSGGGRSSAELSGAILDTLGELGQNGGPLTAREYLAGILVQTTRQADCCEEANGGTGTPPAFSELVCPSYPLLTATFTFTGEVTAFGALASGLTLNGSPPNFTTDPGDDFTGPLLRYTGGQIGTCWYIAVDPGYTGTVSANITPCALPSYGTETGRADAPDLSPGPETFTMFSDTVPDNEVGMAYGVGIAVGSGDPPLLGSQVVIYVGRPDPGA